MLANENILFSEDIAPWRYTALSLIEDESRRGPVRLAWGDQRLTVDDPAFRAALRGAAPELFRARWKALRHAAIAAVIFLVAGLGFWRAMPAIAASIVALVPFETERKIGNNLLENIPWKYCTAPAGNAALADLTEKLTRSHKDMPLSIRVVDFSLVNAFALPGGQIVILRGLLDQAQSPDELAGVLAHEMTHSFKRHSLRGLIASSGLSLLFEVATGGGSVANLGQIAMGQSFTRGMEAEADAGAIDILREAHIATGGFADFFDRLAAHDPSGRLPPFLMSHPELKERSALARAEKVGDSKPALSPQQWAALKSICSVKSS